MIIERNGVRVGGVLGGICSHEASPRNWTRWRSDRTPRRFLWTARFPGPGAANSSPCTDQALLGLSGSGPTCPSSRHKRGQTWLSFRLLTAVCRVGFSRELSVHTEGRPPGLLLPAAPLKTRDCSKTVTMATDD